MHQDEIDKQNIFLVGAKEAPQQQQSTDQSQALATTPRNVAHQRPSADAQGQASTLSNKLNNTTTKISNAHLASFD